MMPDTPLRHPHTPPMSSPSPRPHLICADVRKFSSGAPRHDPGAGPRPLVAWGAGGRGGWGERTFLPALGDPDVKVEAVLISVGAVLGEGGLQAPFLEVLGLQGPCGRPEGLA